MASMASMEAHEGTDVEALLVLMVMGGWGRSTQEGTDVEVPLVSQPRRMRAQE